MRQRAQWHDRRSVSSSGSALRPARIPSARLRQNLWNGSSSESGRSHEEPRASTMEELAPYMRGWVGYFGFCETPDVLIALTRWVRLRLRAALWRQWKTPRRRRAALLAH